MVGYFNGGLPHTDNKNHLAGDEVISRGDDAMARARSSNFVVRFRHLAGNGVLVLSRQGVLSKRRIVPFKLCERPQLLSSAGSSAGNSNMQDKRLPNTLARRQLTGHAQEPACVWSESPLFVFPPLFDRAVDQLLRVDHGRHQLSSDR